MSDIAAIGQTVITNPPRPNCFTITIRITSQLVTETVGRQRNWSRRNVIAIHRRC